jgi:hypothetical protein
MPGRGTFGAETDVPGLVMEDDQEQAAGAFTEREPVSRSVGATDTQRPIPWSDLLAVGGIVAVLILLGSFCVHLNNLFYLRYGPFWDSVSYDERLARVMLSVREGEPIKAFALIYSSTVALPWLEAMALAPFFEPSRAIGTWIQVSWMIVTALVGYVYFRRVAGHSSVMAACCTLIFFFISCTFSWDGGLSDFRLDYLQYTLFGLSCFLYMIATSDRRLGTWILWGTALGLTFLGRATAPVYATVVFGPLLLLDFWQQRLALRASILQYTFGIVSCIYISSWFYISNLSYLYFYYFRWNWAANAKLPLSTSIRYIGLVLDNIGTVTAGACLAIFAISVASWAFGKTPGKWNLRALWCGIGPAGLLIAIGAEPNRNECEIAAFGLVFFAIAPITLPARRAPMPLRTFVAVTALVAAAAHGAITGIRYHSDDTGRYIPASGPPLRSAVAQVTRCMADDMAQDSDLTATFAVVYTGMLNSDVIVNSLLFDDHRSAEVLSNGLLAFHVGRSVLTMSPFRVDRVVTPVQWDMVPGSSDGEKVESIAQDVSIHADFVVAPSKGTAIPGGAIDDFADQIIARLAEVADLRPLCRDVQIGPTEFATIYRNQSRARPTAP